MRTAWISVLAAVALLAPVSAAGEQARIEDASLDAMPPPADAWADITAAWIELASETTLALTVELAALPEIQPGVAYCVVFSDGADDLYGCLAAVPTAGYVIGKWEGDGPDTMQKASGSYATGPAGTVTIDFTLARLDPNATMLTQIRAYSFDVKPSAAPLPLPGQIMLDDAAGDASFALPPRPQAAGGETTSASASGESSPVPTGAQAGAPASTGATTSAVPLAPLAALAALACAALALRRRSP